MELRAAILINIALAALSTAFSVSGEASFVTKFFHQKLDHFDPENKEYFKQRYHKLNSYFQDGAPIFLQIGGESTLKGIGLNFVHDTAIKNNGTVFALEHRYYGQSVPASYVDGRPTYLSSEQALEDIAYFIETHKKSYPHSPWIVCGCSYAGNLATWMRLKYPHLVNGAVAGSAPVLAKVDFYEYFEVVGEVLRKRVPLCHQKLVEANEELTTLSETSEGRKKIARMFRTQQYSSRLVDDFHMKLANKLTSIQHLLYYQTYTSEVCASITGNTHGNSTLENLVNVLMFNETPRGLEFSRNDVTISFRHQTSKEKYMWKYQTCSEFGYFQTLSSERQPFGVVKSISRWIKPCKDWNITSEILEENIHKTNLQYGGKTPNVTNVVFMHGTNDPWSSLGVLSDLSNLTRAFIFEGLTHCEFYSGRKHFIQEDKRIPEWTQMFDEIESIVRSWF